ncbi:alpha/beta hydrolase [Cognatiyoonia sp. IB215182]|uniref:alpha/beta fold hydrolase n=1 Tax=Cognatiyoonia sp. IB215182 TaxID=3097353 RepID=UPI002A248911|nr:alpha/beta hydrolase [Cognatiyoonia sp. IB215182]
MKLRHGQTHYQLDADTNKPLLICIHGWSTSSYVWEPLRPFLRKQGYRLLTYDLYGRGFSDRPRVSHTAELYTCQLTQLLNRLDLADKKLNVLGYSMGGAIAARFVSQRLASVDRLLLLAPAGMVVRLPISRFIARAVPKTNDPHILNSIPRFLPKQFDSEAEGFKNVLEVAQILRMQKRELLYQGYVPALLSSLKGILATSMQMEHLKIASSNVKVRAIFGTNDRTIPSPWARKRFDQWHPSGVSDDIIGAGHGLTYTHADHIEAKVGEFL